jgi:hypothetical protein
LEFQNFCSLRKPSMLIVSMEGLYFDTKKSELELVGCTRPTKALQIDNNPRCIMDSVNLSSMAISYNHYFMFYSRNKSNVT